MSRTTALIGMAGCGKTTIGREAARLLGRPFIDVDERIERRFGPIDGLFLQGEAHFRQCETLELLAASLTPWAVIATGGGTVTQPENMAALKESGIVVFIDRPIERIVSDIDLAKRPLYVCGIEAVYRTYLARLPLYRKYADYIVQNDGCLEEVCQKIAAIAAEGLLL